MQLISFLSELDTHSLYSFPRIVFTGSSYEVLFFSCLIQRFKQRDTYVVHTIDHELVSYDLLVSQASMSFLGQSSLLWLGDIQKLNAKHRQKCTNYVVQYQGPNSLMVFSQDPNICKNASVLIELPESISPTLYSKIAQWLYPEQNHTDKAFLQRLAPKMSLDTACLLMHYKKVLGANVDLFFDEWFDSIVTPESSLFMLSSYFFERNAAQFFDTWAHIKDVYPIQFWISFWSDQLFRAYSFAHYKKTKQILKAKKMAYRLPFSYIQRDWSITDFSALRTAHRMLYDVDFGYKHGADERRLDYVFSSFFFR